MKAVDQRPVAVVVGQRQHEGLVAAGIAEGIVAQHRHVLDMAAAKLFNPLSRLLGGRCLYQRRAHILHMLVEHRIQVAAIGASGQGVVLGLHSLHLPPRVDGNDQRSNGNGQRCEREPGRHLINPR